MHKSVFLKSKICGVDVVDIESDRTFPRHTHDEFGLGYMVSGGQESWSGRGLVTATQNNCITVNPSEVHDGVGYSGKPRRWQMLFVKPEKLASLLDRQYDSIEFHMPVVANGFAPMAIQKAIASLAQKRVVPDECEQYLMVACSALLNEADSRIAHTSKTPSKSIRELLELIHDSWTSPLSLEDMAVTAKMSRYQTLRRFREQVGITPYAYLTQHRVKQAKLSLEQGTSIIDAALHCGFADQSHMTRAFVRQYGVSPGKISSYR